MYIVVFRVRVSILGSFLGSLYLGKLETQELEGLDEEG